MIRSHIVGTNNDDDHQQIIASATTTSPNNQSSPQAVVAIHSDLLDIIFTYLPNFFLLSPPMLAIWRRVFEFNNSDQKIADQLIQKIVTTRLFQQPVLEGMTSFELLAEIVGFQKYSRTSYSAAQFILIQSLVEKQLGISHNVNDWVGLFEKVWMYRCSCAHENEDPENPQQPLNLDLKQLLMVNELVARFSPILSQRLIHKSGIELVDLNFDSSLELSLLYYEDEQCKFYLQSFTHKYLLEDSVVDHDGWNVDFSKTPVRVRGELFKRNNKMIFLPYLNWFSTPKESQKVTIRGSEAYLSKLKTDHCLEICDQEDFLQRYWFKACVGDHGELCSSYLKNEAFFCDTLLNLITTKDGQIVHADGNMNDFFATRFPFFFRRQTFGREYSKCWVTLSPRANTIKAQIYPESIFQLFSAIGGRAIISFILYWNNWFFNWKYSNQFFEANNFSLWGKLCFYGLDLLTTIGYAPKAIYSLYNGFFLHQHVTLFESFMYFTVVIAYLDCFKYIYSFRMTPLLWEGTFMINNSSINSSNNTNNDINDSNSYSNNN